MEKLAINYHLTRNCNMGCKYCFATFEEASKINLNLIEKKLIIKKSSKYFDKMTFVGGEPLLDRDLVELIKYSKELGMTTMLVSNGSMITNDFLESVQNHLDWVSLSIDSLIEENNNFIGRKCNCFKANKESYLELIKNIKKYNYRLKINTVVSKANISENIGDFIKEVMPERWKIFQVLKIEDVNETEFEKFKVENSEFQNFIKENITSELSNIAVAEDNDLMECSYYMINPEGKMFDNYNGKMSFSESLLNIGVLDALDQLNISKDKFYARGGLYNWKKEFQS